MPKLPSFSPSIAAALALTAAVLSGVALLVLMVLGFHNVHRNTVPLLRDQLDVVTALIAAAVDPTLPPPQLSRRIDALAARSGGGGFIIDDADRLVAYPQIATGLLQPGVRAAEHDAIIAAFLSPKARLQELTAPGMEGFLVEVRGDHYGVAVRRLERQPAWRLGIYLLRPSALDLVSPLQRLLLPVLAAVLAIALLTWAVARRRLAPLARIAKAAEDLAGPEPGAVASLHDRGGPELRRAARAVNRLRELVRIYDGLMPLGLARRLAAAPGLLRPQRCRIAVLATGLADFDGLVQGLDDEAAVDLLRRHLSLLAGRITASGGSLLGTSGDGVLALWRDGAGGEADGEPARRAVEAVRAVASLVAEENLRRRAGGLTPFRLCLGLAAGEAVVGDIGPVGRITMTALGPPIACARRLERACRDLAGDDAVRCLATRAALLAAGCEAGRPLEVAVRTAGEEALRLPL